jgi:Protein of unknown function (DUF1614)
VNAVDLTNLDKVRGLGAPVASIGGAGTFDGIFLTGILAVCGFLCASPMWRRLNNRVSEVFREHAPTVPF